MDTTLPRDGGSTPLGIGEFRPVTEEGQEEGKNDSEYRHWLLSEARSRNQMVPESIHLTLVISTAILTRTGFSGATAILIVEQKVRQVLPIAHRVYSLKLGRVAFSGQPSERIDNRDKPRDFFL